MGVLGGGVGAGVEVCEENVCFVQDAVQADGNRLADVKCPLSKGGVVCTTCEWLLEETCSIIPS